MPLRTIALIATFAVAISARAQTPPPAPAVLTVTLDDAVRSARAAFLPTFSLESSVLRSSTPSPLSQPGALGGVADRTSAAGLGANLDLFTGGRRGAELRRAAAARE